MQTWYERFGKRAVDLAAALALLILLAPAMASVALGCLVAQGRPVLFRQSRPGKDGLAFELIKFRSMRSPEPGEAEAPDSERLTRWGRFLRAASLDELPELWNVLRGDMSLVGPRPLLAEYLPLYDPSQRRRHEVRPGITGWAQVNGRNALTWEEKFAHDVWYVDRVSFALDLKIMAMTLGQVIRGRGISAPEHATMPKFEGKRNE